MNETTFFALTFLIAGAVFCTAWLVDSLRKEHGDDPDKV